MTAISLETATFAPGDVVYFDTSALIPLAKKLAASPAAPIAGDDARRASRLEPVVTKARKANAKLISTILAIEEIAALVRNTLRKNGASAHGLDWGSWKSTDAVAAMHADSTYKDEMLSFMEHVAKASANADLKFELPTVLETQSAAVAKVIRKAHRELLRLNQPLDAMDALHIAFGRQLGATHFVSFDKAWQSVTVSAAPSSVPLTMQVFC